MKHVHAMPFGAEARADGSVRFRLYAPAAPKVALVLEGASAGAGQVLPMTSAGGGFYELLTQAAHVGSRYRYRIGDSLEVPDPASRSNPDDPQGPSEVVDPAAYEWEDDAWIGRPWQDTVLYELHVGAFTPRGTFAAAMERLPYLASLGVTAVELMPIADFPGRRGWGYDGVLPFAPDASYGRPDDLKRLIDAAHALGLMLFLDVVYNHFGPEGNYLYAYAPSFFTERHHTPWGAAIDFDGPESRAVRDFFVHNTLYWLEEYRFDGLRYDAVNRIVDTSTPHILEEIAAAAHAGPGRARTIHLVLENDDNAARYLHPMESKLYRAQWNDDAHHAMHAIATGEHDGYYADYVPRPIEHLARCLAEGFDYQGRPSPFRDGRRRGEPCAALPPLAFVDFLQNHDQVGNRAFGERITVLATPEAVRCLTAILLLAPHVPMLFMGQEYAASTPFQFFCHFGPELGAAVARGRRAEFANFAGFASDADLARIPDPNAEATFMHSKLEWSELDEAEHAVWLEDHRQLLAVRRERISPLLPHFQGGCGRATVFGDAALEAIWSTARGERLTLIANLSDKGVAASRQPLGERIHATPAGSAATGTLGPWSAHWYVQRP